MIKERTLQIPLTNLKATFQPRLRRNISAPTMRGIRGVRGVRTGAVPQQNNCAHRAARPARVAATRLRKTTHAFRPPRLTAWAEKLRCCAAPAFRNRVAALVRVRILRILLRPMPGSKTASKNCPAERCAARATSPKRSHHNQVANEPLQPAKQIDKPPRSRGV